MSRSLDKPLTKAETVALWHAVDSYSFAVRAMADITPPFSPATVEAEKNYLATAKRALRKVNELRRQGL